MESLKENLGKIPDTLVADAGYGSEEYYEYMENNNVEAFVKYQYFHKEQSKKWKGFFDNIDHELMIQLARNFTQEKYILMNVEPWLKAPVKLLDGILKEHLVKGTPQGGVISPLLANIFLHFAFDEWFGKQYPKGAFERYADDIIVHCSQFGEAVKTLEAIELTLKGFK
jgi:retron-type reverse transcriptase